MEQRKILVTGCGRSGTKYASLVIRMLGLDVSHESGKSLGADGIVSWYMSADCESAPYGPGSINFSFEQTFHQVRNPLKAIPSMTTFQDRSWRFMAEHIPCRMDEPIMLRCAKAWCDWNELAEARATWRYRIESLPDVFEEFCGRLGVPVDRRVLEQVPTNINVRPRRFRVLNHYLEMFNYERRSWHATRLRDVLLALGGEKTTSKLSWDDLDAMDPDVCRRVREKATLYGYE